MQARVAEARRDERRDDRAAARRARACSARTGPRASAGSSAAARRSPRCRRCRSRRRRRSRTAEPGPVLRDEAVRPGHREADLERRRAATFFIAAFVYSTAIVLAPVDADQLELVALLRSAGRSRRSPGSVGSAPRLSESSAKPLPSTSAAGQRERCSLAPLSCAEQRRRAAVARRRRSSGTSVRLAVATPGRSRRRREQVVVAGHRRSTRPANVARPALGRARGRDSDPGRWRQPAIARRTTSGAAAPGFRRRPRPRRAGCSTA